MRLLWLSLACTHALHEPLSDYLDHRWVAAQVGDDAVLIKVGPADTEPRLAAEIVCRDASPEDADVFADCAAHLQALIDADVGASPSFNAAFFGAARGEPVGGGERGPRVLVEPPAAVSRSDALVLRWRLDEPFEVGADGVVCVVVMTEQAGGGAAPAKMVTAVALARAEPLTVFGLRPAAYVVYAQVRDAATGAARGPLTALRHALVATAIDFGNLSRPAAQYAAFESARDEAKRRRAAFDGCATVRLGGKLLAPRLLRMNVRPRWASDGSRNEAGRRARLKGALRTLARALAARTAEGPARTILFLRKNPLDLWLARRASALFGAKHACAPGEACQRVGAAAVDVGAAVAGVRAAAEELAWLRAEVPVVARNNRLPLLVVYYEDLLRRPDLWRGRVFPFLGLGGAREAPQAKYAKRAGNATQRERLTNYDDVAAALRNAGLGAALRDELRVDVDPDVLELT